jgi:SAM-dependent methyltransferase
MPPPVSIRRDRSSGRRGGLDEWGATTRNDDLASGFLDVDRAADFAVFSGGLSLVESIPFFAECKRESYDLLGAAPGRRVLLVGCGLGHDAAALAKLATPGGAVVGIDGSRAMIEEARARYRGVEGLTFEVSDAAALPFDDASFGACRVDRVLQHIADPPRRSARWPACCAPAGSSWRTTTTGRR